MGTRRRGHSEMLPFVWAAFDRRSLVDYEA